MWLRPRVAVGVAGWTRGPLASVSGKDGSQCHAEEGVKSAVSPVGLVQVGASAEGVKMKQRRPRNGAARPRALRCAPPGLTAVPLPRGHGGPGPLRLTSREPEGAPTPRAPHVTVPAPVTGLGMGSLLRAGAGKNLLDHSHASSSPSVL